MANIKEILSNEYGPASTSQGVLTWFSVSPENVDSTALRRAFDANGLDTAFLPPSIRPVDAFRKATRHEIDFDDEYGGTVFCRDLANGTLEVVRSVVIARKVGGRNVSSRELDLKVVGSVRFQRSSDAATYSATKPTYDYNAREWKTVTLSEVEEKAVQEWVQKFYGQLTKNAAYYDGNAVRGVVRNYLTRKLGAINLRGRGGGVYFVPSLNVEEFGGLAAALEAINGVSVDYVGMPISPRTDSMIADAFDAEVGADLYEIVGRVGEAINAGSITQAGYRRLSSDAMVLQEKAKAYKSHVAAYSSTFDSLYSTFVGEFQKLAVLVK